MNNQHNGGAPVSAFDRDFGNQNFEPVEETVVLDGDIAAQLIDRRPPGDPELAQMHRLYVVDPTGEEWEYPITGEMTLGRAENNHITLPDRAVSRQHLAINTNGELFWFQDLNSGNGTQVNGEFLTEGWLTGDEEIVIGNSHIYFRTPYFGMEAAPPIGAAGELPANGEGEFAGGLPFQEGQLADQQTPIHDGALPPEEEGGKLLGLIVFVIGLVGIGFVTWWLIGKIRGGNKTTPAITERRTPDQPQERPEKQAMNLYDKSKEAMKQGRWEDADQSCRKALTLLPSNDPMRATILSYCNRAGKEVVALHWYKRASALYLQDKPGEALKHLKRIPSGRGISQKATTLQTRIVKKEIAPKLKMARLLAESKRSADALKTLDELLAIDPNYKPALDLKRVLEAGGNPAALRKSGSPRRRSIDKNKIPPAFQSGRDFYCRGQYPEATIFFRQQQSTAASQGLRDVAGLFVQRVQSFQTNVERGIRYARRRRYRRALPLLRKAQSIDDTYFKGCRRRSYKRWLSKALYRSARRSVRRRRYRRAARTIRRARVLAPRNRQVRRISARVRKKASLLIDEAKALIGLDNNEARKLLRRAMGILPSSDPLYRQAKNYLGRAQ